MILVLEENMSSGGKTVKKHVLNYKTIFSGKSLGTTMSNLIQPKSKEIYIYSFIKIIGCIDIISLCA